MFVRRRIFSLTHLACTLAFQSTVLMWQPIYFFTECLHALLKNRHHSINSGFLSNQSCCYCLTNIYYLAVSLLKCTIWSKIAVKRDRNDSKCYLSAFSTQNHNNTMTIAQISSLSLVLYSLLRTLAAWWTTFLQAAQSLVSCSASSVEVITPSSSQSSSCTSTFCHPCDDALLQVFIFFSHDMTEISELPRYNWVP